jgi:MoaA/NifB/PqqE/SkfB family radical SAM enzyme
MVVRHLKEIIKRIPGTEELYYLLTAMRNRFDPAEEPSIPSSVMIELNNTCNLKCRMCGTKSARREKGNMTIDDYRRVIDEIAEIGITNITLYTHGEPLLYPHLPLAIEIAKAKGLTISISTNGNLLDEQLGRALLQAGLDVLRYSIEGASKTSYEKIRSGGNFDHLLDNMQRFKCLRDQLRAKTAIHLNTIVMAETEPELKEFIHLYSPLVDSMHFSLLSNQGGSYKLFERSSVALIPTNRKYPCSLLWKTFIVNWDLTVTACCVDFHGELLVGDLRTRALREIWLGETYQRFRDLHREGLYGRMPLCGACNKNVLSKFSRFRFDRKIHRNYREYFRFSPAPWQGNAPSFPTRSDQEETCVKKGE